MWLLSLYTEVVHVQVRCSVKNFQEKIVPFVSKSNFKLILLFSSLSGNRYQKKGMFLFIFPRPRVFSFLNKFSLRLPVLFPFDLFIDFRFSFINFIVSVSRPRLPQICGIRWKICSADIGWWRRRAKTHRGTNSIRSRPINTHFYELFIGCTKRHGRDAILMNRALRLR